MIQDFSRGKLNCEICWGGKKIHTLFTGESFHGAYFHREPLWDGFRRDTETGYSGTRQGTYRLTFFRLVISYYV